MVNHDVVALALAMGLAVHGLRKRSLSPSGALAAFIIGFLMMSNTLKTFGSSLIIFYLVGSRATKVGKALKSQLEDGHQEAGYRTAWQVLCNSFSALIASVFWTGLFVPESYIYVLLPPFLAQHKSTYTSSQWCPMDSSVQAGSGWSRSLLLAMLGFVCLCLSVPKKLPICDRYLFL